MIAHLVAERFDHLRVRKFEQARPLFDDDDAHAERGEHAGVLDANDAAAHDDERLRNLRHVEDLIAVDDVAAVDGHFGIRRGLGAGGDDDIFAFKFGEAVAVFDAEVVRVREFSEAVDDIHAVAPQLILRDADLIFDHALHTENEILHGDVFMVLVIRPEEILGVKA